MTVPPGAKPCADVKNARPDAEPSAARRAHFGDPCVRCGTPHDEVAPGPCPGGAVTIDTSGAIQLTNTKWVHIVTWPDLSPFVQGYVEALMQCIEWPDPSEGYGPSSSVVHFDWLAPEALALILRDCEALQAANRRVRGGVDISKREFGAALWATRSDKHTGRFFHIDTDEAAKAFPRLTPHLSDDGKLHLRERRA